MPASESVSVSVSVSVLVEPIAAFSLVSLFTEKSVPFTEAFGALLDASFASMAVAFASDESLIDDSSAENVLAEAADSSLEEAPPSPSEEGSDDLLASEEESDDESGEEVPGALLPPPPTTDSGVEEEEPVPLLAVEFGVASASSAVADFAEETLFISTSNFNRDHDASSEVMDGRRAVEAGALETETRTREVWKVPYMHMRKGEKHGTTGAVQR